MRSHAKFIWIKCVQLEISVCSHRSVQIESGITCTQTYQRQQLYHPEEDKIEIKQNKIKQSNCEQKNTHIQNLMVSGNLKDTDRHIRIKIYMHTRTAHMYDTFSIFQMINSIFRTVCVSAICIYQNEWNVFNVTRTCSFPSFKIDDQLFWSCNSRLTQWKSSSGNGEFSFQKTKTNKQEWLIYWTKNEIKSYHLAIIVILPFLQASPLC